MIEMFKEKTLVDYALPESILTALDIKNADLGSRLIGSKLLAPAIEYTLVPPLDLPEDKDSAEGDDTEGDKEDTAEDPQLDTYIDMVLAGDIEDLRKASRVIAVLTQAHQFEKSSNGKKLRLAVEFSGVPDIVKEMRDFTVPYIVTLPPLDEVDEEALESLSEIALRFMLGLLPEPLLRRYAFMHPPEGFPVPLTLDEANEDNEIFTAMAIASLSILAERAQDETA